MKKFTKFFILAGVLFNFSILNAEIRSHPHDITITK